MPQFRSVVSLFAAAAALSLSSCTAVQSQSQSRTQLRPAKSADVDVVSAQFGVFLADGAGRRILHETDKFPAVVSAPFGWFILFKTDKPTIVWREEFELPEEPPTWGPGEPMGVFHVSPDRKTAVTERVIPSRLGFVSHEWRYAPGDPIGAHKIRVYIDGQLVKEFRFDIEDGPGRNEQRTPGSRPRNSTT
jgi:hypothetical protein